MAGRKSSEELIVIAKTDDLILWSCNHTGKFPRNHRFVLGERIVPGCKVQVVVPCRAVARRFGQMLPRPGRSGRPQGSNALPGLF